MSRRTTIRGVATIVIASGIVACRTTVPPAAALPASPPAAARQVEVTPCVWVAGLDGRTSVGGSPSSSLQASFSDDVDEGDWTGMVTAVIPLGRWSLFADAARVQRSATSQPVLAREKHADVEQQIYGLAAGYRLTEAGSVDVDVLAGARYQSIDADLDISPGFAGSIFPDGVSAHDGEGWVDPVVGSRVAWRFAERWAIVGLVDAGGGSSQLTTQGMVSVDFDLSRALALKLGYRHLHTDYGDDDLTWKMDTTGFFAGLGIRF